MNEPEKRNTPAAKSSKEKLTVNVSKSAITKLDAMVLSTGYPRNELVDRLIMDFHETLTRKLK